MNKLRIAAMGDLHMREDAGGSFRQIFDSISKKADILLLCGDLTHAGQPKEAEILAENLSVCKIPVVGVLGNHDYTSNQQDDLKKILSAQHMFVLGDEPYQYKEVGFAGVKGFGGGFDNHLTAPFGEEVLKKFVYEAIKESIKLEESLMKLETEKKVVILHYSPIRQTAIGESLEIFPLLGTSRLMAPIENYNVSIVFHGHAHHGTPRGKTVGGIPVYNVAFPLLSKIQPLEPYVIVEI